MDFVFGLPKDSDSNTGIVVFVNRLSEMAHLASMQDSIAGKGIAMLLIDRLFVNSRCRWQIISDRVPRFTGKFWTCIFKLLGTRLDMFTADHPQIHGQTK